MNIYFYSTLQKNKDKECDFNALLLMEQFLKNHNIVRNISRSDIVLLSGEGRKIKQRIKKANRLKKKSLFFMKPLEEIKSTINYLLTKRKEIKSARKADYVIVTTFLEKELLLENGFKNILLIKEIIGEQWFNPTQDNKDIFMKSFALRKNKKLIVSVGSVVGDSSGLTDYINISIDNPNYNFVYINGNEHEQNIRTIKFELPDNFIYCPYLPDSIISGAFGVADLILFVDHNKQRPIKIYQACASRKIVIIRDNGVEYENLINNKNIYKGVNNNDFSQLIKKVFANELLPLKENIGNSYHIENGQKLFNLVIEEIYNEK